jgi:uncharacterized protein
MSLFVTVFLSLFAAVHYYLWKRLVRDPGWPLAWQALLSVLLVAVALSVPLTLFGARRGFFGPGARWVWPGWLWLGLTFLLLVSVAAGDGVRALLSTFAAPVDPERRTWLSRGLAAGASVLAFGVGAFGVQSALGRIKVRKVEVTLDRLPASLHGTTIVQLTDVHIGTILGKSFIEQLVQTVATLKADLVVITGDLVDGSVEHLAEAVAPLGHLQSRHGTFFVTGNHEFYSGADPWCKHLAEELGIQVLRNRRVSIGDSHGSFDLAGIDDITAPMFGQPSDLAAALEGRDPSRELVLLAHQPRAVHAAKAAGVGLQISGHTHGGQIWPFNFLVLLQQPLVAGLARFGQTALYVSRGTGFWGPPMRVGAPAEVTQIVLKAPTERLAKA